MSTETGNSHYSEHSAVIKFLEEKGSSPKENFQAISTGFQDPVSSYTMVKKCVRLLQRGREIYENDPRPGRLVAIVTEENVQKIE